MLKVDKLLQLFGIVLLFLLGLSGSEDILGKKRAWLLLSVRKFVLDPLIHTSLIFTLAQYFEGCQDKVTEGGLDSASWVCCNFFCKWSLKKAHLSTYLHI